MEWISVREKYETSIDLPEICRDFPKCSRIFTKSIFGIEANMESDFEV